jgi:hypothetical protein
VTLSFSDDGDMELQGIESRLDWVGKHFERRCGRVVPGHTRKAGERRLESEQKTPKWAK